jgi:hypothetical protein
LNFSIRVIPLQIFSRIINIKFFILNGQSHKIEANSSVYVSSTSSYFFFHTKQRRLSPNWRSWIHSIARHIIVDGFFNFSTRRFSKSRHFHRLDTFLIRQVWEKFVYNFGCHVRFARDRWCRPTTIRRFQTLGSVLSLEKLGQTFFAVIMTKTPLLMGFLVYVLNCHYKSIWLVQIWKMLPFDWLKIFELDCHIQVIQIFFWML